MGAFGAHMRTSGAPSRQPPTHRRTWVGAQPLTAETWTRFPRAVVAGRHGGNFDDGEPPTPPADPAPSGLPDASLRVGLSTVLDCRIPRPRRRRSHRAMSAVVPEGGAHTWIDGGELATKPQPRVGPSRSSLVTATKRPCTTWPALLSEPGEGNRTWTTCQIAFQTPWTA